MVDGARSDQYGWTESRSDLLKETLARVAPGTGLRDGLERILRGGTGALIVLGHDSDVEKICDGGFHLDVEFAPTRLRELAKMDGAVVLSTDGKRIVRANVQLVPDPSIPTEESGTRHRAAERTAIQTQHPVISVSASMSIVSVYVDGVRRVVESPDPILSRANVALSTLERYKARLDEVIGALGRAEIEDYVLLRDAMSAAQRMEMVRRVGVEIEEYVLELGVNGRQVSLQLEELISENDAVRELLVRDYYASPEPATTEEVHHTLETIEQLSDADLLDLTLLAGAFGYPTTIEAQDTAMSRVVTGCSPASRGCSSPTSTAWSAASAPSSHCSPVRPPTCRPSRASAASGPAISARDCPAWPNPASSATTRIGPQRLLARSSTGC